MLSSLSQRISSLQYLRKILPEIRRHKLGLIGAPALAIRWHSRITLDNKKGIIGIYWRDGDHSNVPHEFLRDNCQCPSCFYEPATQSLTLLPDVLREAEQGIETAAFIDNHVVIHWKSGHLSRFQTDWLRKRVYSEKRPDTIGDLKFALWGSEHRADLKFFNFDKLMKSDSTLLEWMKVLSTEGINVLTDTPKKPAQLRVLAKRAFGCLYNTMYG